MINYILHFLGLCPCNHFHLDVKDILLLFPIIYGFLYNLLLKFYK